MFLGNRSIDRSLNRVGMDGKMWLLLVERYCKICICLSTLHWIGIVLIETVDLVNRSINQCIAYLLLCLEHEKKNILIRMSGTCVTIF